MSEPTLYNALKDIADAIRTKGVTGTMSALEMPQKIASIQTSGGYESLPLTFTAVYAPATVSMTAVGSAPSVSLEYSTDNGETWTDFIVSSTGVEGTTVTLNGIGDSMFIRAKTPNAQLGSGDANYNTFSITGQVVASGNLASLLNKDLEQGKVLDSTLTHHMVRLFAEQTGLVGSARNLIFPFETLYASSLGHMMRGTSITSAPELVFTTMGNYSAIAMFLGCTSLTTPPSVLPAQTATFYGYYKMFSGCTSLTSTPDIRLTTANTGYCCDEMFSNCSSLTTVKLDHLTSITGGANACRQMFQNCTSLVEVELPVLASVGSVTNGYVMRDMFSGCTALKSVSMPLLSWVHNSHAMYAAFDNCSSLETVDLRKLSDIQSSNNTAYMFSHCTSLVELNFSEATAIPQLSNTNAFNDTNSTFKIVVPDALYDQWIVANNWSQFASQIVKASEYVPAA